MLGQKVRGIHEITRVLERNDPLFILSLPKRIHSEKGSHMIALLEDSRNWISYVLFSRASIPSTCLSYLRLRRVAATRSSHTAIPSHLRAKSGVGGRRPHPETGRVLLLLEMKHCR